MDYKKKYKEALERARQIHSEGKAQCHNIMIKVFPELEESEDDVTIPFGAIDSELQECTYFIPEGMEASIQGNQVVIRKKESEDERIRKALIDVLNSDFEKDTEIHGITVGTIIAWLEKQVTPQVKTGIEWVNIIDDACDERYAEEYAHGEYCHKQSFKWGFQEGVEWLEKQGGQKPAWSEEDELIISVISALINIAKTETGQWYYNGSKKVFYSDIRQWLNSLKNRVLPQSKQEWSGEDEKILNSLISSLARIGASTRTDSTSINYTFSKEIDWLKSLRPQKKQEWTKEDVDMIDWLIRCCEEEHKELCNDKYGHQEIVSDLKRDCRKKWDWLESLKQRIGG